MQAILSTEDWRAAIAEAMTPIPGEEVGKTSLELCEICGVCYSQMKVVLKSLQREGRLIGGKRKRLSIDGTYRSVPVYSVREKKL